MVKLVQMAQGYTFCPIKSLWTQYSSLILKTSEWCVNFFYFVFFIKFDFDLDPDPIPDPVKIKFYKEHKVKK